MSSAWHDQAGPTGPGNTGVQIEAARHSRRRRLLVLWASVLALLALQAALAATLRSHRRSQRRQQGLAGNFSPPSQLLSRPDAGSNRIEPPSATSQPVVMSPASLPAASRPTPVLAEKKQVRSGKKGRPARQEARSRRKVGLPAAEAGPVDDVTVPTAFSGDPVKGARLFRMGCGLCHGSSAPAVSPDRYSARQWKTFFARGLHSRYQKLQAHFTRAELLDVKAFLISGRGGR